MKLLFVTKGSLEVYAHLYGQNPSSALVLYHLKDVNTVLVTTASGQKY